MERAEAQCEMCNRTRQGEELPSESFSPPQAAARDDACKAAGCRSAEERAWTGMEGG